MGGMTIMGLATLPPGGPLERVRARVLVATAAAHVNAAAKRVLKVYCSPSWSSPVITRALRTTNGFHRFVREDFLRPQKPGPGPDGAPPPTPSPACNPAVRRRFLPEHVRDRTCSSARLRPSPASRRFPTTVLVGVLRPAYILPLHRAWEIVNEIEGARLVTLDKRAHAPAGGPRRGDRRDSSGPSGLTEGLALRLGASWSTRSAFGPPVPAMQGLQLGPPIRRPVAVGIHVAGIHRSPPGGCP